MTRQSTPLHELEAGWKAGVEGTRLYGALVAEACLCGSIIRARNTDHAIAEAVRLHNASTTHAQWAIADGWRHG